MIWKLLVLVILPLPLCAQEESVVPAETEKPKRTWYEALEGLTVGLESGTHEYPLKVWYPTLGDEDGYSVRSIYFKPSAAYRYKLQDFDLRAELDFTLDWGAPDPKPGAVSLSEKVTDRKHWFWVHLKEEVFYPVDKLLSEKIAAKIPGSVTAFMTNDNTFYVIPDFPGAKKIEGVVEPGGIYSQEMSLGFLEGTVEGRLGFPFSYVDRYRSGLGFGMNLGGAWRKIRGLNLDVEIEAGMTFIPDIKYTQTKLNAVYGWKNFSAELEIVIVEAFKPLSINPEIHYRFYNWDFWAGINITQIRVAAAYSPYLGLAWNF